MKGPTIFLLMGAGYVCGLAGFSGFMLFAIQQTYVIGKAAWRMWVWMVCMVANAVTAGLIPIFLIGVIVIGDQPERLDFWPRAWLFVGGIALGLSMSLFSAHVFNNHIKSLREGKPQGAS